MILTILAVYLLASTTYAINEDRMNPAMFDYACRYAYVMYGSNCTDLVRPIPVVSRIVPFWYYGLYFPGEPYLFIRYGLDEQRTLEVIMHESMHYILHFTADVDRCESEEAARRVTALWSNKRYDDEWRARYDCEGK